MDWKTNRPCESFASQTLFLQLHSGTIAYVAEVIDMNRMKVLKERSVVFVNCTFAVQNLGSLQACSELCDLRADDGNAEILDFLCHNQLLLDYMVREKSHTALRPEATEYFHLETARIQYVDYRSQAPRIAKSDDTRNGDP